MSRTLVITGIGLLTAAVLYRFPLFHVVSLKGSEDQVQAAGFNAREFAENHWETRLVPRLANAHDAEEVLAELNNNPQGARTRYGRTVGLGRSSYFLIRGVGTIVSIDKSSIGIAISNDAAEPDVLLSTGPFFGNAIRDAPGLLSAGDFAQSRQFNDVAAELNRLAENRVARPLAERASVGKKIRFVGCFELVGAHRNTPPKVIPLETTIR
jgi:predicted lipoprotein